MKNLKTSFLSKATVALVSVVALSSKVLGASVPVSVDTGEAIQFSSIDKLLWDIVATIKYYTLPVMAIALVLLGIKLLTSGDDTSIKEVVKSWMLKILVGGVIIFSATAIAGLIKTNIQG
jgi:hypothetical protein